MIGREQIQRGVMKYLQREILPLMTPGKAMLIEAFAPAVIEANLQNYMQKEWLKGTGLIDGQNANVDGIYQMLKASGANRWPVEIMDFRFSEADLDKLYQCIKEG